MLSPIPLRGGRPLDPIQQNHIHGFTREKDRDDKSGRNKNLFPLGAWHNGEKGDREMELDKIIDLEALAAYGFPERLIEQAAGFTELMMQYRCALMEVQTKLNVLNEEFTMRNNRNPFESIKSRLKSPKSILEKLQRKGFEISVRGIEENLADVAGIRVICSFPDDIYMTAKMLTEQDDIRVLEVKDYIINPKPNGYRSLHLILEIPIFLSKEKKNMKVEVQFRTIAMDFWASLEHKLKYKKSIENAEEISRELQKCAEVSSQLDLRMQALRERIEGNRE